MKRKEFIGLLGTGLIGSSTLLSACSKFLDKQNPNAVNPSDFWKNANDAQANVTAIYGVYLGQAGWSCANNWYFRRVFDLFRGDDIGITHDVPDWWGIAQFTTTDATGTVAGLWKLNYQGILYANQAIENIPNITGMDTTEQARLIGEAKFMRAFFYFSLITNFLNVPLILTVPKSPDQYAQTQATSSDTWAQIIKDLTEAASALPAIYDASDKGRVTKGAALGLLGKSYLYQQQWKQASDTFAQIISAGNYSLLSNFADIFALSNTFNEESLLEINYGTGTFNGQTLQCPRNYEEAPSQAGGWYECYPNQFLFDEMSKEKTVDAKLDPRIYTTIIWPDGGLQYYGQTYSQLFGSGSSIMAWGKYSEFEMGHPLSQYSGKHVYLIRYADILLMHAEALNNQGMTSQAVPFVNQVRSRAHLSDISSSITQGDLVKEIEHQRIIELADEGNRFYDLLRWGTIKENLLAHGAIGAANFVSGKNEYLPIPLSELQTNSNMKQNPGY